MNRRHHNSNTRIALFLALVIALTASAMTFVSCNSADTTPKATTVATDAPKATENPTEPEATEATEDALAKVNEEKYLEAFAKLEASDYDAAYALFAELGDYKDAAKELAKFHYVSNGYTETYGVPNEMDTETVVITYNEDNLPVKCEMTYLDGVVHTCILEYDENGRLISCECDDDGEFYGKREWTYDANGNNLTYTVSYYDGTLYTEERTYDENGNNITIEAEGKGGYYDSSYEGGYSASYDIFYDANGNHTKFVAVDGDETLEGEFSYTEDGIITKGVTTVTCGEEVQIEEELYDAKGNLIKKTITKGGEIIESSDFTYDENGNCLSELCKWSDEDGEGGVTVKYTYDANGNCIKKVEEYNDGYKFERNVTFRLVYVPYEYSEQAWTTLIDYLHIW